MLLSSPSKLASGNQDRHRFEQISDAIFRWNFFSKYHKVDLTSHCIITRNQLYLFDPVSACSLPSGYSGGSIILTNSNHERVSGVAGVTFDMKVYASQKVQFSSSYFPAERFDNKDEKPPDQFRDWELMPIEGGADGEFAFFNPDLKIAIFGDSLINLPGRGLEILPEKYCSDRRLLEEQLRLWWQKYMNKVHWMLFAHGSPLFFPRSAFDMQSLENHLFHGR